MAFPIMSRIFKLGIIGCGNISNQYFEGLRQFPFLKVVAAADLDPARAKAKAGEHGVPAYRTDDLLADAKIDLVINLTVPKAHAAVNLAILKAGKHAYSEKPFALNLAEGRRVLKLAKASGLRVGCAPDTFLGGGIQTARSLIDAGAIGEPVAAAANMAGHGPEDWHPDPEFFYQTGGGPMLDMGPYYLTALVNLLGPIRRVTGSARISFSDRVIGSGRKRGQRIKVEIPTHCAGVYDFAAGPIASVMMSFDVWSHSLPIIEIYGAEGSLRVPDPNTFGGTVELRGSKESEWRSVPLTHSDRVGRGIGVADMVSAIVHERPHRASGDLAFHVLEGMQAVQTASENEAPVHLKSRIQRPAPLPAGLKAGEIGD
jgi:predicted dehydrogenase